MGHKIETAFFPGEDLITNSSFERSIELLPILLFRSILIFTS